MPHPIGCHHQTASADKGGNDNQPKAKDVADSEEESPEKVEHTEPRLNPTAK